jgi:hypothetical protein
MVVCTIILVPFPLTIYNPYGYTGGEYSLIILTCTDLMYFDGEHILIIIRKIRRTQPFRLTLLTLIDANVLVCIVLPVILPFPGRCGCVWSNLEFLFALFVLFRRLFPHWRIFLKDLVPKDIFPTESLLFLFLQAFYDELG